MAPMSLPQEPGQHPSEGPRKDSQGSFDLNAHRRRAQDARQAGDLATAIALLRECLAHSPAHSESWNDLGELLFSESGQRADEADRCFKNAFTANPQNFAALENLVEVAIRSNKRDEATALLGQWTRLRPRSVKVWIAWAKLHLLAGNTAGARTALTAAAEIEPGNRAIQDAIEALRADVAGVEPKQPNVAKTTAPAEFITIKGTVNIKRSLITDQDGAPLAAIVPLSRNIPSLTRLEEIENDERCNDVISDLVAYTGFSADKLAPYLLRYPEKHYESEFNWYAPKDEQELLWSTRCNSAYLFANAIHPYDSPLDIITKGKVLDYGAGAGCNTIALAKRGIDVDFVEIGRVQADFINFRAERHKLKNVREVRPYHDGEFDPVLCIQDQYDAIIAWWVLDAIPNYPVVVKHFIERLNAGGMIFKNSPFDPSAEGTALHVRPSVPLKEAMVGMERIGPGLWKKK